MIAKKLRRCLIWSAFLHIVLLIMVINMSSTTPVAVRVVDAFIVESTVAGLEEPKSTIKTRINRNIPARNQNASRPQLVHQRDVVVSHPAGQNVDKEATPPSDASPSLTASQLIQPTQSIDRAAVVPNGAATGPPPVRPEVESPGSKAAFSSAQNFGAEKVLLLGDAGSPRFIHRELPVYPFMARKHGKEGKVLLRLALDAQGKLMGIDTVEANGFGFAEAARSAIRKSTFAPAVKNGRTVSSQVLVSVKFVLQ
ncbi:MAG: TonB family protein [Desulfuromonadaceae bacterium]|nr:TonB family protein [Desulfuromonadaceae bacterium]